MFVRGGTNEERYEKSFAEEEESGKKERKSEQDGRLSMLHKEMRFFLLRDVLFNSGALEKI